MSARARFTVSGPGEEGHGVPSLGAGVSVGLTFATRRRRDIGEVSYYVREEGDVARAVVTKQTDGVIVATVYGPGELEEPAEAAADVLEVGRLFG